MTTGHYFSANAAVKELQRRRALRPHIEEYWATQGVQFPTSLCRDTPSAVMGRHVATFRYEDAVFIQMAEEVGLLPTWLTYTEDQFVTVSNGKRSLLHPQMVTRVNKHGMFIPRTQKLASIQEWVGKPLSDITMSDNGGRIVDFHHRRLLRAYPQAIVQDTSYSCRGWGGRANKYYLGYLSLFLAHAVLLEDYHGGESGAVLGGFTDTVFEPAFRALVEMFGVQPLIVPLPWWKELALYPDEDFLTGWRGEGYRHLLAAKEAA